MTAPQDFAAVFARTLDLFRDPNAKQEQKTQFRALVTLLKTEGAVVTAQHGRLVINGEAIDEAGSYESLVQRLEFHAVKEITIPTDPPLAETFVTFVESQAGEAVS